MSLIFLSCLFCVLFCTELLYFRIADRYNIIDKPNHRSSHNAITIRGGGIIFVIGVLFYFVIYQFHYPYFILGLLLIATVSFLDDLMTLNNKVRLIVHLIAVSLMLFELGLFGMPWYYGLTGVILVISTINAYNFMDGINGITAAYSLVTLIALWYINKSLVDFTADGLLAIIIMSVLIFSFFNFRKKAKCFAGDVGSVSIALIVLFLLLQLILKTQNFNYILLLLVYGLDAVSTIVFRLIRKENIFEAHRSHFYQYLANERRIPHLIVSSGYAIIQLVINIVIIILSPQSALVLCLCVLLGTIVFVGIRFATEGSLKLLGR